MSEMKKWIVVLPITGQIQVHVEAEDQQAATVAAKKASLAGQELHDVRVVNGPDDANTHTLVIENKVTLQ